MRSFYSCSEHLKAFFWLGYQMTTLVYEGVSAFQNMWIEDLGPVFFLVWPLRTKISAIVRLGLWWKGFGTWKQTHGTSVLEVLAVIAHVFQHCLNCMLALVCTDYQMTAVLRETVAAFEDTWMECLGGLDCCQK